MQDIVRRVWLTKSTHSFPFVHSASIKYTAVPLFISMVKNVKHYFMSMVEIQLILKKMSLSRNLVPSGVNGKTSFQIYSYDVNLKTLLFLQRANSLEFTSVPQENQLLLILKRVRHFPELFTVHPFTHLSIQFTHIHTFSPNHLSCLPWFSSHLLPTFFFAVSSCF